MCNCHVICKLLLRMILDITERKCFISLRMRKLAAVRNRKRENCARARHGSAYSEARRTWLSKQWTVRQVNKNGTQRPCFLIIARMRYMHSRNRVTHMHSVYIFAIKIHVTTKKYLNNAKTKIILHSLTGSMSAKLVRPSVVPLQTSSFVSSWTCIS